MPLKELNLVTSSLIPSMLNHLCVLLTEPPLHVALNHCTCPSDYNILVQTLAMAGLRYSPYRTNSIQLFNLAASAHAIRQISLSFLTPTLLAIDVILKTLHT